MKTGLDFSGKKEYEKLDFLSQSIQDVQWGLIGEIFDVMPDVYYLKKDDLSANFSDVSFFHSQMLTFMPAIKNLFLDPRFAAYSKVFDKIISKFINFGHVPSNDNFPYGVSIVYKIDLLQDKFYVGDSDEEVPGIPIFKTELKNYGEVLQIFNDRFYLDRQYTSRTRNESAAKRTRHIIRVFGGKETSDSWHYCSRALMNILNQKLKICGEPSSFPIRNLDLYADLIKCIDDYISTEDPIAYSKICQYKIKIQAGLPIYEVSFL